MRKQAKMLGNIKRFGRCSIAGHQFCNCSVVQDIQTTPISKAEERDSMRLELEEGLDDLLCANKKEKKFLSKKLLNCSFSHSFLFLPEISSPKGDEGCEVG